MNHLSNHQDHPNASHQKAIAEYIKQWDQMDDELKSFLKEKIAIKTFKKGSILLQEGQISTISYYTIKGCVRKYYLIDGEEKTTGFYTEGQSINSYQSYTQKTPSKHYLSCLEDTTLSIFTLENEKKIYEAYPQFESICRMSAEEQLGEYQEKLARFITSTPEQRYLNILETRPELLGRVPQYHLASYLGMKPESLSRIRKRIAQKK